jgi:threonine/homoserine/homoserine lactone efflux protein
VSTAALLGFVAVALLGVITPGLDTMVTLRHSLLSGRSAGAGVVLGVSLGCLVWGTASILGLSALLAVSEVAYRTLQLVGAAYLIGLGCTALRRTFVRRGGAPPAPEEPVGGVLRALRAGLLTNLLNPKVGVFYISLLPQFLPAGAASPAWGVLLVALHVVLGIGWLGTLVLLAERARRLLLRERVRRWLDRTTAGVLVGLGVAMVAEAR